MIVCLFVSNKELNLRLKFLQGVYDGIMFLRP